MASIAILIIISGCAVLLFLKGTVVRAIATIIVAVCALVAAFGFFEFLAGFIISHADKGSTISIVNLAQTISFMMIFIIVFAGLQTLAMYLTRDEVDFGLWPERIGRAVFGLVLGFIVSGVLVTALAMAPLPSNYPYERFDSSNPKPGSPGKVFLNADGFVTNLFSTISSGSLSGKKSFNILHPDYLSQVFLNRLPKDVSLLTSNTPAISIPTDKAVWPASDEVKSQIDELNSRSLGKPSGAYSALIVRIGIKRAAVKSEDKITAGKFALSQLRVICKKSSELQEAFSGKAINVYPIGYLGAQEELQTEGQIELNSTNDFGDAAIKDIDFVFCVPSSYTPILAEFKLNSVAQILQNAILKDNSEAPPPATYYKRSEGQSAPGPGNRGGSRRGGGGSRRNRGGQNTQQQQQQEAPQGQGQVENLTALPNPAP
jgi:hypothetical protein